ncbi:MAG: PKD domain-containing protein [Xanthomonadaceae bacterium]|nr:PKD domain-containing protein [Xanthomonadaceae bacterium]
MASPLQARERTAQLHEAGTIVRTLPTASSRSVLTAASSTRVCETGAKWIRLDFRSLKLHAYDSLVLKSSGGDRYVFQGGHWNDRSFSSRALRGSCVDIQPYFASRDSGYDLGGYTVGTRALAQSTVVVAGAGDICDSTPADCKKTSDLIVDINPVAVFTAGDNAYDDGTIGEYNDRYHPNWGRFKSKTKPTPGNHEYGTSGAKGYFDYFNGTNVQTGLAGDRSKGYYSWDVGDWHFIALNTMSGGEIKSDSAQLAWLKQDLAANTKPCTAAYFHHPRWSTGNYSGYSGMQWVYAELYKAKADLILVGHDHNYQRSKKINASGAVAADGFRQLLVGTGGRNFYALGSANTTIAEVRNGNTWGVMKLTLSATDYVAEFVPVAGSTFTDRVTGTCNKAGGNVAPVANFTASTNGLTATFTDTSSDSDGSIASRSWNFGDGSTSTAANPSRTYAASGTYNVTLTVTDNAGLSHSKTTAVTVSGGNVAPVANFSVSTSGLTATFTDSSSDSDGSIASRSWNFGDGSSSTLTSPSKTYAAAGTYNVTLTVTDNGGLTHSRTTAVTVGGTGNVAPVANFTSSVSGLTATFTDTSTDSDGSIVSRSWDFGDGATSTATNPSRTYAAAGTYNVTLTVVDDGGLKHSRTAAVTVSSGGGTAPDAHWSWSRASSGAAFVKFTAAGSTDSDGQIVSWLWDFGDGTTSTDVAPRKVYRTGTYTFRVTVTDNSGLTNTASGSISVTATSAQLDLESVIVLPPASANQWSPVMSYTIPSNSNDTLTVRTRGTAPDAPNADLYVRVNSIATSTVSAPTFTSSLCAPYKDDSNEGCLWTNPSSSNTYYVTVHARGQAYRNVTLQALYAVSR